MTRTFSDSLAQDLASVFFNTNEFAELVTLKRGQRTSDPIAVIPLTPSFAVTDDESRTKYEALDFDVIASTYKIRGEALTPQKGDKLIRADDREYDLMLIPGSQCYEPTSGDGLVWRLHTKRVK